MYQEIIRKAYYNPETGFTGLNKLFKQLKKAIRFASCGQRSARHRTALTTIKPTN